jgi:predicted glutamine amidotransferase
MKKNNHKIKISRKVGIILMGIAILIMGCIKMVYNGEKDVKRNMYKSEIKLMDTFLDNGYIAGFVVFEDILKQPRAGGQFYVFDKMIINQEEVPIVTNIFKLTNDSPEVVETLILQSTKITTKLVRFKDRYGHEYEYDKNEKIMRMHDNVFSHLIADPIEYNSFMKEFKARAN